MRARLVVLWLSTVLLAPAGRESARAAEPRREVVAVGLDFPDAVEPGALTRLCAKTGEQLRELFRERGAPFDPSVLRKGRGGTCHVDYTPTVAGFRADPEDLPVRELFVNVDGVSFLAGRTQVFGDSLDISKDLVKAFPRPIPITLGTRWELAERWYEEAADFHYGDSAGRVDWRRSRVPSLANPWAQDYLKSGRAARAQRILVTRRLFEGRREDGEPFRPMLDSLKDPRFARSNLSWEGGDLQFVRDPRDPDRLVLVFGDSARAYWGKDLSPEEYAYVLRREFGADVSVDLTGLAPHVDYFVAFLPADRIALVSQPVSGNRALAEAAAALLAEQLGPTPPPTLAELRQHLARPDALSDGRRQVERLLKRAKAEAREGWPRTEVAGLGRRMERYVAAHCPASPAECFSDRGLEIFLSSDRSLLGDWAGAALLDRTESTRDLAVLSIVESQLRREPPANQERIDAAVRALEELGFRVVRVPRFGGDRDLKVPWSGISYVNSLLVDRTLFVPRFGLGEAEDRILEGLGRSLPPSYEVVPVFARHMLLRNGGIHCTVAIVRE